MVREANDKPYGGPGAESQAADAVGPAGGGGGALGVPDGGGAAEAGAVAGVSRDWRDAERLHKNPKVIKIVIKSNKIDRNTEFHFNTLRLL